MSRSESKFTIKKGSCLRKCTFIFQELIYHELKTFDFYSLDPKGGELYWIGLKEWETILEDLKRSDAQIDVINSVKRRKTHRATW